MKALFAILMTSLSLGAQASSLGTEGGNGGDLCEDRIKIIRDDIQTWIVQGGSSGLSLPSGVSVDQYNRKMVDTFAKTHISCTDSPVSVSGAEKTCSNQLDSSGVPQILCDRAAFNDTAQGDQYILVHHEFAGLAGFEVNVGADSDYEISNQLSGFLQTIEVTKLAITKQAPLAPYDIQKNFADFVGHYQIIDCTSYSNRIPADNLPSEKCKALKTDAEIYFGDGYYSPAKDGPWVLFDWKKDGHPRSSLVAAYTDANESYINYSEICSIDYGRFSCNGAKLHLTDSFTIFESQGLYYVDSEFARSAAIDNGKETDLEVARETYVLKKIAP